MSGQKKLILVVEDEPSMQRILLDRLTDSSFEVLSAQNGEDGLGLSLQKHPDLILLDLMIPKMSGMDMLKRLREDPWGKAVPVIILSNLSPDTDTALQQIINTQPAYYFVKSDIKLDEVVGKIKELLS